MRADKDEIKSVALAYAAAFEYSMKHAATAATASPISAYLHAGCFGSTGYPSMPILVL